MAALRTTGRAAAQPDSHFYVAHPQVSEAKRTHMPSSFFKASSGTGKRPPERPDISQTPTIIIVSSFFSCVLGFWRLESIWLRYCMFRHLSLFLFGIGLAVGNVCAQPAPSASGTVSASAAPSAPAMENYAHLPLAFEKQSEGSHERFVARGQGYVIRVDNGKATILVSSSKAGDKAGKEKTNHAVSLEFAGSKPSHAVPGPELPGKVNYIRGNDPQRWQIGLSTYARVTYPDAYPGIDVVYYGNQQQLEFDLVVRPGADPEAIRLKVEGAGKLSIDGSGALNLGEAAGGLKVALPQIYQNLSGTKKSVPGHYAIVGQDEVAFRLDPWDHTRPLVIDPTIVYSTLFGGVQNYAIAEAIALDTAGNIVISGYTGGVGFPTVNAAQSIPKGSQDLFVTKINAAGTALIYSTY